MRRNPAAWRDAPSSRGRNLFEADRHETSLHLFAAAEGGWGEGGHLVSLAACALLVVDRQGRGVARLTQLSVSPLAASNGNPFEWEWRLLDAADLLAEERGHLWISVSAAEGSEWREALISRGYRPISMPEGEQDGLWLRKATPLRDMV